MNSPMMSSPARRKKRKKTGDLLHEVLEDHSLFQVFYQFCEASHCSENMDFIIAVINEYKDNSLADDTKNRAKKAREIFDLFIREDSIKQLGVATPVLREVVEKNLETAPEYLFNIVYNEVVREMALPFSDFFASPAYLDFVKPPTPSNTEKLENLLQDTRQTELFERFLLSLGESTWGALIFFQACNYYEKLSHDTKELNEYGKWIFHNFLDVNKVSLMDSSIVPVSKKTAAKKVIDAVTPNSSLPPDLFLAAKHDVQEYLCKAHQTFIKRGTGKYYEALNEDISLSPGLSISSSPRSYIFKSLVIHGQSFKNRIGVRISDLHLSTQGEASDWLLVKVGSAVMSGIGFLCIEGVAVSSIGRICNSSIGLWDEMNIDFFKRMNVLVEEKKVVPGIQIVHSGRKKKREAALKPFSKQEEGEVASCSDEEIEPIVSCTTKPYWRGEAPNEQLSIEEISNIIASFVDSAKLAVTAGFKMIEIEAGSGFLIHQFLSPVVNDRTDQYGGSFENRIRFCVEIIEAIKKTIPSQIVLVCKISCGDPSPHGWSFSECQQLVAALKKVGCVAIVCSSGGASPDEIPANKMGTEISLCRDIRKKRKISTISLCPNLKIASYMNAFIAKQMTDLIYVSDSLANNPNLILDLAREENEPVFFPSFDFSLSFW